MKHIGLYLAARIRAVKSWFARLAATSILSGFKTANPIPAGQKAARLAGRRKKYTPYAKATRFAAAVLGVVLLAGFSACTPAGEVPFAADGKVHIIATLFPQYDFARVIGGEHVEVHMLLKPGTESHSYDPTPADILRVNRADLFIYTGEEMESWAHTIVDSLESQVCILDLSEGMTLTPMEEVEAQFAPLQPAGEQAEHGHSHHHTFEPHIWTDPLLAMQMAEHIRDTLCQIDPANADEYRANAAAYLEQLDELDQNFRDITARAKRREIVHAGRFAMYYFAREYDLSYLAAYDSCSSETEPNARAVAQIIDTINKQQIPVIYYEEMASPRVAGQIAEETGAKALLLHSCHNVSQKEMDEGASYLSLMKQNARNLEAGLC